jgi:hypothetical protein
MILICIFDLLIYPLIDSECLSVMTMVNSSYSQLSKKRKSSYCVQNKWTFALRRDMLALDVRSSKEWDTTSDHNFAFNPFIWFGGLNGLFDHHAFSSNHV